MDRFRQFLSCLLWLLVQQVGGAAVNTHTEAEWKTFLKESEKSQEMMYEFTLRMFMIADDYNASESREVLNKDMAEFDTLLEDLLDQSPHETVTTVLNELTTDYGTLKALLASAAAENSIITADNLRDATNEVYLLYPQAQTMTKLLAAMAEAQIDGLSTLRETLSLERLTQIKKMMTFTLAIKEDVDVTKNLALLEGAYVSFNRALTALLDGVPFVGLEPTTEKCTLKEMGHVLDEWGIIRDYFNHIFLLGKVEVYEAHAVIEKGHTLLHWMEEAAKLYIEPSLDCEVSVSDQGWINLIETSSVQAMYAQKIGRLFLQAAYRVNTLDSRVLISDSIVGGTTLMGLIRAGSAARNIPPPITQEVASIYASMWNQWTQFTTLLSNNVQTVSTADTSILIAVEDQSRAFFHDAMEALDSIEQKCVELAPTLNCPTLRKIGRQRVLLQQMTFEASLQAVGLNREVNRERMLNSTAEFDRAQTEILHGLPPLIPRTENYCQIWKLKDIQDAWVPLRSKLLAVAGDGAGLGDYSIARIFSIDTSQWSAGVDPMFAVITSAKDTYLTTPDDSLCSSTKQGQNGVSREEWEAAVRTAGLFRAQFEKVSAEYLLRIKGMGETLDSTILATQEMLTHLVGGWSSDMIPAPPTQTIAQRLFEIEDGESSQNNGWTHLMALLETAEQGTQSNVVALSTKGDRLLFNVGYALEAYVDAAWLANQDVPGEQAVVITRQATLVEKMLKDTLLLSMNQAGAAGDILNAMNLFDDNFKDLRDGNGRENKYLIPKATEDEHLEALANISRDWGNLKPKLKAVADNGRAGTSDLQQIQSLATKLRRTVEPAVAIFSTMTVFTTKVPINLMIPLPFTGSWVPGHTMKVAAEVAQDIINEQQLLLPTYNIISSFFDDACDADVANRFLLKEFASSTAWVGVGGMACSAVCESLAVVTASLFLPTVAFECSEGMALSDQNLFPSFVRLGTQRDRFPDFLKAVGELIPYAPSVKIVSGNAVDELAKVEAFQAILAQAGLESNALSAAETDFDAIIDMMSSVKKLKERFMNVWGTEAFYRRVLCASGQVGTPFGSTWTSEGVKSKAWWAQEDPALMLERAECNGAYVKSKYQGGISVTGRAFPDSSAMDDPLECYEGYTSQTLHEHIVTQLAAGYPASDPNRTIVTHPHVELINLALDGMCAFTKMVRFMLSQGHAMEDLRTPASQVFIEAVGYLKNTMTFTGASGTVDIDGNDLPNMLALWQAVDEDLELVASAESQGAGSIDTAGVNSQLWSEAPADPIVEMTDANWIATLEAASIQQMYGQKMTRLFLQAAQRVNTLDSRVLFSDSRVNADQMLVALREGSELLGIPEKWYTEYIKKGLDSLYALLYHTEEWMAEHVYTVSVDDTDLIADAANESSLLYYINDQKIHGIVDECHKRTQTVPCHVIEMLSHQRALLQKMSLEAALQGAGYEVEYNKLVMMNSTVEYEHAHQNLIHGMPPNIPRTEDHCILQQMKEVYDQWLPFKENLMQIFATGATNELVFAADTAQWKAGVDLSGNSSHEYPVSGGWGARRPRSRMGRRKRADSDTVNTARTGTKSHTVEEGNEEAIAEEEEEYVEEERGGLIDEGEEEAGVVGMYNAVDVVSSSLDEMQLPEDVADEVMEAWNLFVRTAESNEQAGDAIFSALFESAPSLQGLFKSPRAVFVVRFMQGMQQLITSLKDPKGLKVLTETLGFQHLDFDVTVPRVVVFRDSLLDLLQLELGSKFGWKAKDGWATLLNYVGGAFIFVRVKYADRLKILASSWSTANNNADQEDAMQGAEGAEEAAAEGEEGQGESGELKNNNAHEKGAGSGAMQGSRESGGSSGEFKNAKNTSVPTTFNEMFVFNAAVMGFANNTWMNEVLSSFDAIVRNVSNTYRLQEECDVLSLRIAKCKDTTINLGEFKAVLLASLRSLVPKDWNSAHEVAWSWLWENVERMLKALFGKSALREKGLSKFFNDLEESDMEYMRRDVYVKFFGLAPAGQDHFKQSATRLHFLSGKVISMTLDMYTQPKVMIDNLSAIGLRHVGYGIPTDLFGPYVTACVQVVRTLTVDDLAEESFRWSLSLMSRVLVRVVSEGSTIVMKAINQNSGKQLKKAVGCAPRGKRALWMLNIQVGTQSISPLLWSIETGSIEAAHAIVIDLLTFRADRDRYYYGMDTLFDRHPDVVKRLCIDAPGLLPVLLDGLIWRSRTTEKGMRRVNYYLKHLLVDAHGNFSKTTEWVTETKDPKLVCHPVLSLVTDMVWSRIAMRSFLLSKTWFLITLAIFILSQAILKHVDTDSTQQGKGEAAEHIRIVIAICRLFIYAFSLGLAMFVHVKHLASDIREKNWVRFGRLSIPASFLQWQELASLMLTGMLFLMLVFEPFLHCLNNDSDIFLAANCAEAQGIIVPYSVFSTIAMLLYFSLLIDLSVLSTRISAFTLVCFRVLSEVALFLFALTFMVLAFASGISALSHNIADFTGIPRTALSLFKVTFGMLDGTEFDLIQDEGAVFVMVLIYIITTVVFLMNLLIAQLNCAYQSTYTDMLGYARLNRGKIVTETMPTVSRRRWEHFVGTLKLDDCVEFGEGDIGIPGGIQMLEPASQNITTTDMIRRFGGSTSPSAPWPEEENSEEAEDRFDRMEKLMERSLKKVSKGKGRRGQSNSDSQLSGSQGESGSAHESTDQ